MDASYGFMGVIAGAPVWPLPETQDPSRPFYDIGSEKLDTANFNGNLALPLRGAGAISSLV